LIKKTGRQLLSQEHSRNQLRFLVRQRLVRVAVSSGVAEVGTPPSWFSDAIGVDYAAPESGHPSISKQLANSTLSRRRRHRA
jgi:hypothetical protein